MYKEKLATNLETARKAEKRSSFLYALLCLGLAAFMAFGAWGLITKWLELPDWFPIPEDSMTIGCIGFGLLILGIFIFFVVQLCKNMSPAATDKRMETILENARKVGPEDEVFAALEAAEPRQIGKWELRYNEEVISGVSPADPDACFLYPMSMVARAGIAALGKKRSMKYHLYIHGNQDGKIKKCAQQGDYGKIINVLDELQKLNPKLEISKNA